MAYLAIIASLVFHCIPPCCEAPTEVPFGVTMGKVASLQLCPFTVVKDHISHCKSCHSNHISWSYCMAKRAIGSDILSKIICDQYRHGQQVKNQDYGISVYARIAQMLSI